MYLHVPPARNLCRDLLSPWHLDVFFFSSTSCSTIRLEAASKGIAQAHGCFKSTRLAKADHVCILIRELADRVLPRAPPLFRLLHHQPPQLRLEHPAADSLNSTLAVSHRVQTALCTSVPTAIRSVQHLATWTILFTTSLKPRNTKK
jgi:hypothetical protein